MTISARGCAMRSTPRRCRRTWAAWCSPWPSRRADGACPRWTSPRSAGPRRRPASRRTTLRALHPMMAERLRLWRLASSSSTRLASAEDVYLYRGVSQHERQGRAPLRARRGARPDSRVRRGGAAHQRCRSSSALLVEALEAMRAFQAPREPRRRLSGTASRSTPGRRSSSPVEELRAVIERYARATGGLGIEMVELRGPMRTDDGWEPRELRFFSPTGRGVMVEVDDPPTRPAVAAGRGRAARSSSPGDAARSIPPSS